MNHIGGGYSQNARLGLKLSPHIMPLFLECPDQKHKANENTSKHNPNKKQKQTINDKKNQGKTFCKEESQLKNYNQQQQRRLKMKKLSFATNQLVAKAL